MAVITAKEVIIPVITERARPRFQNTARIKPPRSAPLVNPRNENAAFNTKSTCRLRDAMKINAPAQTTVEILLNRRKKPSLFLGKRWVTKSIVETEERDVRAELTDDIAAERMATMRKPRSTCGTSVIMKMGKT